MEDIYNDIENMTNQQAAEILKGLAEFRLASMGRGCGKTYTTLCVVKALMKGAELLEKTQDA